MQRELKYKSAFDIIGPIMVGPSSSHTAGAVRIGKIAHELFKKEPTKLTVTFYGSFAETYKGHGTALAIVAGVLGFDTHDERIPNSIGLAEQNGIKIEFITSKSEVSHSNTANLNLMTSDAELNLTAISIGGGSIQLTEVSHHSLASEQDRVSILLTTQDELKTVAELKRVLETPVLTNLQTIGQETLFLVHTESTISPILLTKLKQVTGVTAVVTTAG
ncbi:L-serine ammonia-lyase, iron-sulfur-dependent subunit beta [Carnobacterium gallinarum]|uniref:L-serine ammonia-lyase, iron-sulfur-dependent subunit beta n=1 Tax=Carnobacterium gallinarum TaxID=2749 RepID=UPI00054E892E|nr:L-serine ammonia-lyase, iron-sulfur-dependent subunit beta [Carnobacterium gallinarum]